MRSLLDPPPAHAFAQFVDSTPRFLLTIDTEEEFDWNGPIRREGYSLAHVPQLAGFQRFCESEGVVPVYLVDWPIACCDQAGEILREAVAAGRAEIGLQLHPWVNPPFAEELCENNTFAGNLPAGLVREKLHRLHDRIERQFGTTPLIYRAGRYGLGAETARQLVELGIAIDTSVRAKFDYSARSGPDFRRHPLRPYWLDDERSLLELPLTTVFWGLLRGQGDFIYPRLWRIPALRGALARARLLERIPLTPEGVEAEEALRAIDIALDDGLPVLVFSFHSPSLHPGHTPYVLSEADLALLYEWWRRVFAYCRQRGVHASSVADIMQSVRR